MSDKNIRFSNSLYYEPENSKSIVITEARCKFLNVVVKYEPDLLEQLVEKVVPLGLHGVGFASTSSFDLIAELVEILSNNLDKRNLMIKHNEWMDQTPTMSRLERWEQSGRVSKFPEHLTETYNENVERFSMILKRNLPTSSSAGETKGTLNLVNFYKSTCLYKLGPWALSLLLQYAGLCDPLWRRIGRRRIEDPTDARNLFYLVGPRDISEQLEVSPPPKFRFTLLSFKEYHSRLELFEETKDIPMVEQDLWFYDYNNDEYISFQLAPTHETSLERAERTQRVFKEALKHHERRCKEDAESKRLLSFERGRKRVSSPEDRYYWLYLYLTTEKTIDEIEEEACQTAGKEKEGKIRIPSVEKDLRKTAELMAIPFVSFHEKRRAKEIEGIGRGPS